MSTETTSENATPKVGRNEPCPCGSGKKYKRCHGVDAEGIIGAPQQSSLPEGFDPSKIDPKMIAQFQQLLGKLPKGQLNRLQGLMQKAMSGKDISAEAGEFEKTLPTEFQNFMTNAEVPEDLQNAVVENQEAKKKESKFTKLWGSLRGKKAE